MGYVIYYREVYWRMIYGILSFSFSFFVTYIKSNALLSLLLFPLTFSEKAVAAVYFNLTDIISIQIYTALVVGFIATIPYFWFQLWLFFRQSLFEAEAHQFTKILIMGSTLYILSLFFSNFLVMPKLWFFFITINQLTLYPGTAIRFMDYVPSVFPYLHFLVDLNVMIACTIQMPSIFYLLFKWEWVSHSFFIKMRQWFFFSFLLWATFISPPDLFSQLILFFIMVSMYELFLFFSLVKEEFLVLLNNYIYICACLFFLGKLPLQERSRVLQK